MRKVVIIDLIRVIAAFAVVLLHVGARMDNLEVLDRGSINWWSNYFYNFSQFWAVPVFLMISGGLLLKKDSPEGMAEFYKKRLNKILIPLVFWTLVYFVIRYYLFGLTAKNILGSIVKGAPYYHLWFLYTLLGLYVITPFLRKIVNSSSKNELKVLMGISFFLTVSVGIINTFLNKEVIYISPFYSTFLLYLGYYIFGYYALNYNPLVETKLLLSIVILSTLFISLGGAFSIVHLNFNGGYLASYLSPFTIIQSSTLFLLFLKFSFF
jgi:surface polysaccharide O-acyltransferase-like enzyme